MFERSTLEICVVDIRKGRWTSLAASAGKGNDNKEKESRKYDHSPRRSTSFRWFISLRQSSSPPHNLFHLCLVITNLEPSKVVWKFVLGF